MTDKEKLRKALEALKRIGYDGHKSQDNLTTFARDVYAELTQPRMETVGIDLWGILDCSGELRASLYAHQTDANCNQRKDEQVVKISGGTYQRPIPEPEEEEWEGIVDHSSRPDCGRVNVPKEWIGRRVKCELV